ncbi:DUF5979 domain-containing protein [Corynebacterium liangguodongii]|nr:DUF5979 domain-containing protein [Corynebacterium liangguodongii]
MFSAASPSMSECARRTLSIVATLLVALAIVAAPVGVPQAQAQATVPNATNWSFKDCSFRQGDLARDYANNTCWISFNRSEFNGNVVTKTIGPYTLTMRLSIQNSDARDGYLETQNGRLGTGSAFGDSTSGQGVFHPYAGDGGTPIIRKVSTQYIELYADQIAVTKGGVRQDFSVVFADAEGTKKNGSVGEIISVVSTGGTTMGYGRVTPQGYDQACTGANHQDTMFGPGTVIKPIEWPAAVAGFKDFVCRVPGFTLNPPERPGTWTFETKNPSALRIGMGAYTNTVQAFAMGINLSRASVPATAVSVDSTAFEQQQTGQVTTFSPNDLKVYDRQGTTDTPIDVTPGTTGAYIRARNADNSYAGSVVYRSTATGAQANMATKRYEPTWTCTLTDSNSTAITRTFKAGSEPEDMPVRVNNAPGGNWSEVVVTDPTGRVPSCSVQWKTRFLPTTLNLQKSVTGNAAGYKDIQLRQFTLNYTCTDLTVSNVRASEAYPGLELTGFASLERGTSQTTGVLPKGSSCTVTEDPASAAPPSGTKLDLQWNTAPTGPVANPNGGTNSYSVQLQDSNTAHAYDNYNYGTGTLVLSKEIFGDPVIDGFQLDNYSFEVTCAATNLPKWTATITMSRSGTAVSGSTELSGIPVGQDCTVRPLTDLAGEQRNQIRFTGRTVTVDGATVEVDPAANYSYHFTLPETDGARSEIHFHTGYEYIVREVFVNKLIVGPASGSPDLVSPTYTANYRCTAPTGKVTEGTAQLGGHGSEASIGNVPVGSSCNVWENAPGDTANTVFTGARVRSFDASDIPTEVDNSQAHNASVLKVWLTQTGERNLVTVENSYDYKLGTVTLNKDVVNTSGLNVPSSYTFRFNCGTRNIGQSAVFLTGTAQVAADGSTVLQATDPAANDQEGAMGVPYGNTCTFTEDLPTLSAAVIMDTNVPGITVSAPTNSVTATNTFTAAGDGFTIYQALGGEEELIPAGGMSYTLVCTVNEAVVVNPAEPPAETTAVEKTFTFNLTDGQEGRVTAEELPLGSECVISEANPDSLTRTNYKGTEYKINRELDTQSSDPSTIALGTPFTIGQSTVFGVSADYSYKPSTVTSTKQVIFDTATEQYISDPRKQIKRDRQFPITLVCTSPDGSPLVNISTTIKDEQTLSQGGIPEGAECAGSEGATTTASGVTLTTKIGLNTGEGNTSVDGNSIEFTAREGDDLITIQNVYSRRLTDIKLDKVAILPANVREQYAASGQDLQKQLYTHQFHLQCFDPETGDTAMLFEQTQSITGEGTTTYTGVPVGADCKIDGDNFGSLRLEMRDGGQKLEAYLKPEEVDWVIDRAGGNAVADTALDDGVTSSPAVLTVDDAAANHVTLTNHYNYQYSPVQLEKRVEGTQEDLSLLTETRFQFAMQCKAIGFQTNVIGTDDNTIPNSLGTGDFTTSSTPWTYTSPGALVPAGSLCTFREVAPAGLPQELTMSVASASNEDPDPKDPATATGRAPVPGATEPTKFTFTDTIERRTAPVGLKLRQAGYLGGAAEAGYTLVITCGAGEVTKTYPLTSVVEGTLPTTNGSVVSDDTVLLPVGLECAINAESSPALAARGQVEVVGGDRRPYMRYAEWAGEAYNGTSKNLTQVPFGDVGSKVYNTTFTVPGSAPSDSVTFVLGAEFYHPRALYDVRFTKEAEGEPGSGNTFAFTQACSAADQSFELKDGGTHIIKDVPVDSTCVVTEVDDANPQANPALTVQTSGDLIGDAAASSSSGTVSFVALATSGEDTSTAGDRWALTVLNSFPGIEVTKRIPGTPVSAVTGAVADRAILADDATTMEITYTVKNTGVFDAQVTEFKDPSLAGYSVNGTDIGEDGVIPASVCAGGTVPSGQSLTCTVTVDISGEPTDKTFSYFGDVTITATSNGQTLTATDGYGALRLTGIIGALLPDTGMQTLAWMLVLGLLLFGFGAWRFLRREDGASTSEEAEAIDATV